MVQRGTSFPNPEELFCDDMIQWHGVLDDVLQGPGFPSGPDPENDQVLAALRQTLDEQFEVLFPPQIAREWTETTASGSLWTNYRIDERGNLGVSEFGIKAECYRPRLSTSTVDLTHIAGIDCSGFVQRASKPNSNDGHDCIPYLGGRLSWDDWSNWVGPALSCDRLMDGYQGNTFTALIGGPVETTFKRMVPGDIIIKPEHVAIVNYVLGDRPERGMHDICLIQAIGVWGDYKDTDVGFGEVTDVWRWDDERYGGVNYNVRRLLP